MQREPLIEVLQTTLAKKIRPPLGIVLGSPREAADLVEAFEGLQTLCYQMDLYQAEQLEFELRGRDLAAEVVTRPDLWDLWGRFGTGPDGRIALAPKPPGLGSLIYPVPKGGERALKIDMIEQAYHTLAPHGTFAVLSPYEQDRFLPQALKKVFGKVHAPMEGGNALFWCQRDGDRPRRRHEIIFQARINDERSVRFVSRPGVFSYGRVDPGARALVEAAQVEPGQRVLDFGCGCGTNGVMTALKHGAGFTSFLDSNVRATALAQVNAQAAQIGPFDVHASAWGEGFEPASFDAVLANPPYFGHMDIARRFIEQGKAYLKPEGTLYLVTRQVKQIAELLPAHFNQIDGEERRGYVVFCARSDR